MLRSLYTAASGMTAQQFHIDTISHNLANVNTTGFKRVRPEFQDLIYLAIRRPTAPEAEGAGRPVGLEIGLGVRTAGTHTIFQQGNLQPTENPLDVALSGPGFFVIRGPGDEEYYTRDGSFKLDAEGNLVTTEGYRVEGVESIPAGAADISIARDGSVSYLDEEGEEHPAGKLAIVRFANPAGLEKVGHNLYRATAASGEAREVDGDSGEAVSVEQGYLEASNVQVVEEMVKMITAQRAYELNSKVIQASDEMLSIASNIRR
ncbi:MAG: flagellar basal-body rod protein FlgG [Clostridia bacterium]|uniref:Flagellar basal-body rod protein FlgG n=1 Tax=Thermacetogenium phaeum TaxID=85874 RepID=A0A101FGG5_9THEO|nr:MAG: Flagellar basal-body rod protein FlgG [Thermacetogenium phaeum]MDK2880964.1 flagellar basal-body rod protein FlgG [Clostridia bacterium]MDN5365922.1 flagellar basal-body rod protein FlgG [Thermacetogenium sp.]MDN5375733.1 flagellar basal-body rod protein FlgG [Thermacetogenium sp.]